jgi:hypothetical protein
MMRRAHTVVLSAGADTATALADALRALADRIACGSATNGRSATFAADMTYVCHHEDVRKHEIRLAADERRETLMGENSNPGRAAGSLTGKPGRVELRPGPPIGAGEPAVHPPQMKRPANTITRPKDKAD